MIPRMPARSESCLAGYPKSNPMEQRMIPLLKTGAFIIGLLLFFYIGLIKSGSIEDREIGWLSYSTAFMLLTFIGLFFVVDMVMRARRTKD